MISNDIYIANRRLPAFEIYNYFVKYRDVFYSDIFSRVNVEHFSQKLYKNAEQFWLYCDHQIKGFAGVYMNNHKYGFISTISISKECQGKGLGNLFLKVIEEKATYNGLKEIRLEVDARNIRAISFYKKNGYVVYEKYPKSWMMKKILSD